MKETLIMKQVKIHVVIYCLQQKTPINKTDNSPKPLIWQAGGGGGRLGCVLIWTPQILFLAALCHHIPN